MTRINLFGARQNRGGDTDWYDNPHEAIARCRERNTRKIVWLCYTPDQPHPVFGLKAWETVYNLVHFEESVLPRFEQPGSE